MLKPCVYFANHASHLDYVLIWKALPRERRRALRPVAGRDYWERTPARRFVSSRVFHALLIDRRGASVACARAALTDMTHALDDGDSLVVFPEGTRSTDGAVHGFKSGLYHLARIRPGVDLVPVFVENTHRILPKGRLLPAPRRGRVVFGAPLRTRPGEDKPAFLARARAALVALGEHDDRRH
jgi:1-acyl-sn-glycerol-3-phosphate acyltransferase